MVTSHTWWSFGQTFMLGIDVIHHLPVEEALFYPFGGILCLFLYILLCSSKKFQNRKRPTVYWGFLVAGALVFVGLAWATWHHKPAYLISQLVVYDLMCCLFLAPIVAGDMDLLALSVPVILVGSSGFGWDYFAIKHGWWVYHAVTRMSLLNVPIEEFNYYLFAPASAISIYLAFCQFFKVPQTISTH